MVRTSEKYRRCLSNIIDIPRYGVNFTKLIYDLQAQNSIFGFLEIVGYSQHDLDIPIICMSKYNADKIDVLHTVAKGLREGKIIYFPLYRQIENPPKILSPDEIVMEMATMSNKYFPKLVECVDGKQYIIAHGLIINYADNSILINTSYKVHYNRLSNQVLVSSPSIIVNKYMVGSAVPLHKAIINKFIPYMLAQSPVGNLDIVFKDTVSSICDVTLKSTDNLSSTVIDKLGTYAGNYEEILKNSLEKVLNFNSI